MDIERQNELMKISLRFSRKEIQEFLLTSGQKEVLFSFNTNGITATELSSNFEISIQNASTKLSRLYEMGYLSRELIPDPTGGCMYHYEKTPQTKSYLR